MKTKEDITLAAPCGTFCGICECYIAKDDPAMLEYLISRGIPREKLPCPGCREVRGECPAIGCTCATYTCSHERNYDFCFECEDFPCPKLNPAADRAGTLPHNIKIFNLCCIQSQGLAKWMEQAPMIKQRYFKGKMRIGLGPQVE